MIKPWQILEMLFLNNPRVKDICPNSNAFPVD